MTSDESIMARIKTITLISPNINIGFLPYTSPILVKVKQPIIKPVIRRAAK
jgi:hypothetical protein